MGLAFTTDNVTFESSRSPFSGLSADFETYLGEHTDGVCDCAWCVADPSRPAVVAAAAEAASLARREHESDLQRRLVFGAYLKSHRARMGISQADLNRLTECSHAYWGKYECAYEVYPPSLRALRLLSVVIDEPLERVLEISGSVNRPAEPTTDERVSESVRDYLKRTW